MYNQYKKYSKKILCSFFSILIFIICLNIIVNPYDIFDVPKIKKFNYLKPDKTKNQRLTKIINLKLEKNNLESVFLGSSRVNMSISEAYYKEKTGEITKNLGMNALSHDETFKVVKNAILVHPELKTIYVGLDFFRFLEKVKDEKRDVILSDSPNLTISEFNPVILSFNTTISSVNTILKNLKKTKKSVQKSQTPIFLSKVSQYKSTYTDAVVSYEEIEKLKQFKKDMSIKGYKVVFYTNPTHVLDLVLIDKLGILPLFFDWKVQLANAFSYKDFDFINKYTTENIQKNTKYFYEISHSTAQMGNLIIDDLIDNTDIASVSVNRNNINKHNTNTKNKLKEWEKKNSLLVKNIDEIVETKEP